MKAAGAALALVALLIAGACSSAPEPTERSTETRSQSQQYADRGAEYAAAGDLKRAELFLSRALTGFRSVDDRRGAARVQIELARIFAESGLLQAAAANLDAAESVAAALDDPALRVEARTERAELSLHRNEPARALKQLSEAERLLTNVSSGDEREHLHAVILHNRAVAHARQNDFDAARSALRDALRINIEREALSEIASNRYMLASVESRSGNYDAAMEHARAALSLDKETENSARIAMDLEALGSISMKSGSYENADDYFSRAYGVYEALGSRAGMIRILQHRAEIAEQQNNDTRAREYRNRMEELEQEGGDASETS